MCRSVSVTPLYALSECSRAQPTDNSDVHQPVSVTPSHAFSGCSRAQPTGNDDVYQPVSVTPPHAFSGCGSAQPTGDDHDSPRAVPPPGKGGARAGYDDGGAPGRFMGYATRGLAFEATTVAIHIPHFTHSCPPSIITA